MPEDEPQYGSLWEQVANAAEKGYELVHAIWPSSAVAQLHNGGWLCARRFSGRMRSCSND
jgi:hypothetical protein